MRFISLLLFAGVVVAAPATAGGTQGNYAGALRTALNQAAQGICDPSLMQPDLLATCKDQMLTYGPAWKAAGSVKSMMLISAEPAGLKIETYQVTFTSGKTETWHIGGLLDGRFDTLRGD